MSGSPVCVLSYWRFWVILPLLVASPLYAQPSGSYFDDELAEYVDSDQSESVDTQSEPDEEQSTIAWLAGTVAKAFGSTSKRLFDSAYKLTRYVICRMTLFTLLTVFPVVEGLVSLWNSCVGSVFDFTGFSWYLGAANYYFPVSESLGIFCGLLLLSIACAAIRWVLKAIPTIG